MGRRPKPRTPAESSRREKLENIELATAAEKLQAARARRLELEARATATREAATRASAGDDAGPWHRTERNLTRALEISRSWFYELRQQAGAPEKDAVRGWPEGSWRAWLARRAGTTGAAAEQPEVEGADAALVTLRTSTDPLALARAGTELAARRLASSFRSGEARDASGLKAALEEQRRAEAAWLTLAERKGELIPRAVAVAVAGSLAALMVRALDGFEEAIASQVETWLADPAWMREAVEVRRRTTATWARAHGRALREVLAGKLDTIVAEAARDAAEENGR